MIIDEGTDATIARRIAMLDKRIHQDPQEFKQIMVSVGAALLSETIDIQDKSKRVPRAVRKPQHLLTEYFSNRYDLDHGYDQDTDEMLTTDQRHADLINRARAKSATPIKSRQSGTVRRVNTETVSARDELRLYRLESYIGRVITAVETTPEQKELPSAG